MTWGTVVRAACVACVVATARPAGADAVDPVKVRAARDRVYASGDYQRDLPDGAPAPPAPAETPAAPPPADDGLFGGAPIASILLWILIAVCLALVAVYLLRELAGRRAGKAVLAAPPEADDAPAPPPLPDDVLAGAEALAAAGRFADAIHEILLATLAELASRAGALRPSWTSREVLARLPIPDGARPPFAELVATVEQCHFGAAPAAAPDFIRCRARYQVFADAYRGAAA